MSIKRYIADADTTITNAFNYNLSTRATGSNMGASDILEVFSLYAQANTSSQEASRALVKFPIDAMVSDRQNSLIPASGSVKFLLKLSNAPHPFTVPKQFILHIQAVSRSWSEGTGLDMEQYLDTGYANWVSASSGVSWTTQGGDYHSGSSVAQYFETGVEDLSTDITNLVEEWINGTKQNFGVGIKLTASLELGIDSQYTKKFFSRSSEFFYKRPWIEAQFDSSIKDNRQSFFRSSSLAPAVDNLNLLYLYNRHRGRLVNIPAVGSGSIYISLYSGSTGPEGTRLIMHKGQTVVTGGYVSTGIYTASVALDTTLPYVYDVWHDNVSIEFVTGSEITVLDPTEHETDFSVSEYILNIKNLKQLYSTEETGRFNVFAREKDWSPTVYTVANNITTGVSIENAYYKIFRISDGLTVIPYGTGSMNHTRLSFDGDYNYFDLDMKLLEPGYTYGTKFTVLENGAYYEQSPIFKFRVQ